jgi:serine/threonine-protein kinase
MPVLPLNTIVGKYRIDDLAGVGGMGEVYRAVHIQNGTVVAIKSLNNDAESGTALARFKNEAIIQFNLRHPNVAALYEYVDYPGHPCVVMGFVEGPTLQDLVRERGLPLAKALDILAGVCDAFAYMHLKGVMHRDIKSENIRIAADGTPKLLDFGIAVAKSTPVFTRAGQVIGTLQSLAPEHVRGLRGDARSDVWALGVLLYEMLTGTLPFDGTDVGKVAKSILEGRYAPASELKPGIPGRVERLISGCLLAKPEGRFASGGILLREVQRVRRGLQPAFGMVWIGSREMPVWHAALRVAVAILLAGHLLIGLLTHLESPPPVGRPSTIQRLSADTGPAQGGPAGTDNHNHNQILRKELSWLHSGKTSST